VRALASFALALALALAAAAAAAAHARISPPVSLSGEIQLYSLAVPTEQAAPVTTTTVVLTVPAGFSINSFVPSPGWHRVVHESATAGGGVAEQVTWSGGEVPSGEDAFFQFLGEPSSTGSYSFQVEQIYSNSQIVDWSGAANSANPAPSIEAKSSLGGGGTPLLTIVALAVAVVAVIVAALALISGGGGKRQLA
jgi:uncharacterized protein YcnI